MGTDARSPASPAPASRHFESARPGRAARRWPLVIAGLVLSLVKVWGWGHVFVHRPEVIMAFGIGLGASVLRTRPTTLALFAGGLFAAIVDPHPLGLAFAVGAGAVLLLLTLFIAIATVLRAASRGR